VPPVLKTNLEREIASEERIVGIPTDQPLTDAAIVRRHGQLGVLLGLVTFAVIATLASDVAALRILTAALALAFGVYALRKERHLRKLEALHRDEVSIHLDVADSILRSGALRHANRELVDLRNAVERDAGRLAEGAADALLAHCACVRLVGPSGETPLAAVCDFGDVGIWLDPSAAHESARSHEPVRRDAPDGRTVIAVPLEHRFEVVGVLEVISGADEPYTASDAEIVVAFARGAVCGLMSGQPGSDTPWISDTP
jgi:hypothetical protein